MASVLFTYLLWLFFGLFGLHHFYLGRICHAITWYCTCGGLGFGYLMDFFQIPFYVAESNNRKEYIKSHQRSSIDPYCSTVRFIGQMMLGSWLGTLTVIGVPVYIWENTYYQFAAAALMAFNVAIGVYIVGNIGLQERTLLSAWTGAWPAVFFFVCLVKTQGNGAMLSAIISAISCNRTVQWRKKQSSLGLKHYFMATLLYTGALTGIVTCNIQVSVHGKMVYLTDILREMSFEFDATQVWVYFRTNAWDDIADDSHQFFSHFFETHSFVSPGELDEAYKIVGVDRWTKQADIRSKCRQLLRETHPDKSADSDSTNFVRIQQACELLGARRHNN